MSERIGKAPGATPEKIDLGLDKVKLATQEELTALKELIGIKNGATEASLEGNEFLIDDLKNEAMRGFGEDLAELNISEGTEFNQEYGEALDKKIKEISEDQIINSEELKSIETFMTDAKKFTKLQKAIEDKNAEQKVPATIDRFLGLLNSIGIDLGAFGKMTGDTIAKNIAWIGGLLGFKELCGIKCEDKNATILTKAPQAKPETVDPRALDTPTLLNLASQTGEAGEPARLHLSELFPKEKFGEISISEPGKITFVNLKSKKPVSYTFEKGIVSGFVLKKEGESGPGENIDGSQTAFLRGISKLSPPEERVT